MTATEPELVEAVERRARESLERVRISDLAPEPHPVPD